MSPIISFPIIWYKNFIKYDNVIEILYYMYQCIIVIIVCIVNIIIILKFKSKLKNTKLNKTNFKNERKAIRCTFYLNSMLLITWGPALLLQPFKIYKYTFIEFLHDIYFSFSYFYIITDPLIVLLFNRRLRIDLKLIFSKLKIRRQNDLL